MRAADRDQPIAAKAPTADELTEYDLGHFVSYEQSRFHSRCCPEQKGRRPIRLER
jgi:hypothetical protein